MTLCLAIPPFLSGFSSVSWLSALCCLPFPELALVAQLLHVPTEKLVFPLGSPLHAEAAHQEDVGMEALMVYQITGRDVIRHAISRIMT